MTEKNALLVGFWMLFFGGCIGIGVGAVWFYTDSKTMLECAVMGMGGSATITMSALIAFLRSKL